VDALVLDENNMPHIEVDHTVAPITTDITAFERGSPYFLEVFQLSLTLTHLEKSLFLLSYDYMQCDLSML
jgi:hypothetical protein